MKPNKTPGLDAPMTTGQKWSVVGMILAFMLNLIVAIWVFAT